MRNGARGQLRELHQIAASGLTQYFVAHCVLCSAPGHAHFVGERSISRSDIRGSRVDNTTFNAQRVEPCIASRECCGSLGKSAERERNRIVLPLREVGDEQRLGIAETNRAEIQRVRGPAVAEKNRCGVGEVKNPRAADAVVKEKRLIGKRIEP